MVWELYHGASMMNAQQEARSANQRSRQTESRTRFAEHEILKLEARVDSLALRCQAMWELLSEATKLTTDDIVGRMEEIDLRDGKADGKIGNSVADCPSCHRPVNGRRSHCIYCGEAMAADRDVFNV